MISANKFGISYDTRKQRTTAMQKQEKEQNHRLAVVVVVVSARVVRLYLIKQNVTKSRNFCWENYRRTVMLPYLHNPGEKTIDLASIEFRRTFNIPTFFPRKKTEKGTW